MRATRFRVQNFRNVDDSGWIPLDQVTAFVGRNESGKTTLLKALHKFNPATHEKYIPLKDFPRDRYAKDYLGHGTNNSEWRPVCSVAFAIPEALKKEIGKLLNQVEALPEEVIFTRYYNDAITIEYAPCIREQVISPEPLVKSLGLFVSGVRRLPAPTLEQEEEMARLRLSLVAWATRWGEKLKAMVDLKNQGGVQLLTELRDECNNKSRSQTAFAVEALVGDIERLLEVAQKGSVFSAVNDLVKNHLPVMVYFEDYGILDSVIYLPRFLDELQRDGTNPRVRTISAMFKHVGLSPSQIAQMGKEQAQIMKQRGQAVSDAAIAQDQETKAERAIQLNAASNDISQRFSAWWSQRSHKIRYHADGDYFRIWITDDKRPGVEIELEARSKGFQWFFSFYLVFLVEAEAEHKNAILLLDEPGMHLHPTAQQELIAFLEKLSASNQLVYTTHSPFLIDHEHLERVRPVSEDETGHSCVNTQIWPKDRETTFPLQAAVGYAMVRGLFQRPKNLLVEGMSDYYYLQALAQQCRATGRSALPEDISIIPCGGANLLGRLASLFLAHAEDNIMVLADILERPGQEVEDILGEEIMLPALKAVLGRPLKLTGTDRRTGSLARQIESAARNLGVDLPEGWREDVAIHLVAQWAEGKIILPTVVLEAVSAAFAAIQERFAD